MILNDLSKCRYQCGTVGKYIGESCLEKGLRQVDVAEVPPVPLKGVPNIVGSTAMLDSLLTQHTPKRANGYGALSPQARGSQVTSHHSSLPATMRR